MADEEKTGETVEYADFSDMGSNELPDTIEETPAPTEQAVQYFEEETQEETSEEETPTETPEPPKPSEEDRYWQSEHDKLKNQYEQDKQNWTKEIETIKTQLPQEAKEEPLVAPVPPDSDDPLDMMNYLKAKDDYNTKVMAKQFETQNQYFQQLESERQQRAQAEQANAMKAYQLGKLQTVGGLTPEEATRALDEYSKASENEDDYFKKLADFHRFNTGQPTKPKTTKSTGTPPLATQPGESQTQKVDEADQFFGDLQNVINENF